MRSYLRPKVWVDSSLNWVKKRYWWWHRPRRTPDTPSPDLVAPIQKILVFKPDDIGDVVYALSAVRELRESFPKAEITVVTQPKTRDLWDRTGLADHIHLAKSHTKWIRFHRLTMEKATLMPLYDLSIFLRTYPGYFKDFKKIRARQYVIPDDPRLKLKRAFRFPIPIYPPDREPQAYQMLNMVRWLAGRASAKSKPGSINLPPFLWKPEDLRVDAMLRDEGVQKPYLVAHPFNRVETREYPTDGFMKTLEHLSDRYQFEIIIIGGPDDLNHSSFTKFHQWQGKLSLAQTAYLIQHASAYLGTESGPAHLASMLKIPTITLMGGHAAFNEWRPLGNHTLNLKVDVDCAPCFRFTCPRYDTRCLKLMPPSHTLPLIDRFLKSLRD